MIFIVTLVHQRVNDRGKEWERAELLVFAVKKTADVVHKDETCTAPKCGFQLISISGHRSWTFQWNCERKGLVFSRSLAWLFYPTCVYMCHMGIVQKTLAHSLIMVDRDSHI